MGDTVNLFSAKSSSGTVGSRRGSREKSEALGKGFRCRTWSFHQGAQGAESLPTKILTQHVFFWMMNLVDWWWTDDVWLLQTSVTQKMRALWTIDITEIKRYAMSQDAEGSNPKIFFSCLLHGKTAQDEVIRRDHDTFTMAELNLIVPGWRVQSMWVAFLNLLGNSLELTRLHRHLDTFGNRWRFIPWYGWNIVIKNS